MSNFLHLGFSREIELPQAPFLLIDDDADIRHLSPKLFDPTRHRFNFFNKPSDILAREYREIFYTIYPQGDNTLTVRNGKWALLPALKAATSLNKVGGSEEVDGLLGDILESEVLKNTLCGKPNFTFESERVIYARINRAELGEFNALVLGLILMSYYPGQLVVPDFGWYGRKIHTRLIREERLIAGVDYMGQLSKELQAAVIKMPRELSGATVEDAELFAKYENIAPHTIKHHDYIEEST